MKKRITKHIEMSDEFKKSVIDEMNATMDKAAASNHVTLTPKERQFIMNRAFDQLNRHISHKAKMKTLWVFDIEETIPVIVDMLDKPKALQAAPKGAYKMRPNLSWMYSEEFIDNEGVDEEEFERIVLEMLKEDAETAAFYGALSFATEGEYRGR